MTLERQKTILTPTDNKTMEIKREPVQIFVSSHI